MKNDHHSNHEDESDPIDARNIVGIIIFAICLSAPMVAASALLGYILFSYGRVHYRVIGGTVAIYSALVAFASLFGFNAIALFLESYTLLPRLMDSWTIQNFLSVTFMGLLHQAPLSIMIGGTVATFYSWWRWWRRPEWKEYKFRRTPVQLWSKRKNIKDIQNDRNTPPDGRTLGVNHDGERINQSEQEGRAHTFIVGSAGSGKTTTILNGCRDQIKRGEGLIFIDMKGHPENAEVLAMYAERYGRKFYHWTSAESETTYDGPAERPAFYDPLGRGDATRKTNLLIAGREATGNATYYTNIVQNYIQKAFEISNANPQHTQKVSKEVKLEGEDLENERKAHEVRMAKYEKDLKVYNKWVKDGKPDLRETSVPGVSEEWKTGSKPGNLDEPKMPEPFTGMKVVETDEKVTLDSFSDIIALLDPQELKKRTLGVIGKSEYYDTIIAEINLIADRRLDTNNRSALDSMRDQLGILMHSVQGRWLKKDPKGTNNINLFDAAHNGDVVVFSIDSSNYPQNAAILGDFIIQDLKTVTSELRNEPSRYPLNVIIDEFAAIGSDNIVNLINKSRDAKMPVTLSTQSLGDLKAVSDSFLEQLTGTITSFVIHRANMHADAQMYASLTQKEEKTVFRKGVSHSTNIFGIGKGRATGQGTVDTVEEHLINPSEIQQLNTGEAFYICKSPSRLEKIQVYAEPSSITSTQGRRKHTHTHTPVVEEQPVLMLKSGENLDAYKIEPSENFKISMAEQEKEKSRESIEVTERSARRADMGAIRRILGDEHINEISVKKHDFTEEAEHTDTPAVVQNTPHTGSSSITNGATRRPFALPLDMDESEELVHEPRPVAKRTALPSGKKGLGLPEIEIDEDDYADLSVPAEFVFEDEN